MRRINFKYLFLISFFNSIILMPSCDKNKDYDEIPFAFVNFRINPNSSFYWRLNSTNGWEKVTADDPSRGIIIYRLSENEFMAYERTCPYDPFEPEARINGEDFAITVACPTCASEYILLDGTPFKGPARRPLKQYNTSYNGNSLHVFN